MKSNIQIKNSSSYSGFTLIEILLVVAIIAILAGIVIFAINPSKQLADSRNAQRRSDVNTILNAVYQYTLDNNGQLPDSLQTNDNCAGFGNDEICNSNTSDCTGRTNLSALTTNQKYLVTIPTDPSGAGYFISKNSNNRITVCAPAAEQEAHISVTR